MEPGIYREQNTVSTFVSGQMQSQFCKKPSRAETILISFITSSHMIRWNLQNFVILIINLRFKVAALSHLDMLLRCVLLLLQVHCADEVPSRLSTLMFPVNTTQKKSLKNTFINEDNWWFICVGVLLTGNLAFCVSFSRILMITLISSCCFFSCCSVTCKQEHTQNLTI